MNYYREIKTELINNEVYKKVKDYSKNIGDLKTYYKVGKLLSEAGKHYGEGIIKKYSIRLTNELGKGYKERNLYNMKLLYEKLHTVSAKLTWSHYTELLRINDVNKINYYIKMTEQQNLSVRELRQRIKNNEYERLDDDAKQKLINKEKTKVQDFIKNPILIKNSFNTDKISEKMLQRLILEDIPSFLSELGEGYSFIKNEYPIKLGDRYNYIDLLLFNYLDNRFIVIELKITELKKEHIGQIQTYMNYIDKNLKTINQELTIGIIICKKNNKFTMKYVTNKNVMEREFELI